MSAIASLRQLVQESPIVRLFILGYFAITILGWLLLLFPPCQNTVISGIDALFTAASGVSTTGLATVDIGKSFTFLGQLVLLLLVQLGGIGYMVFSSFVVLALREKIPLFCKINLMSSSSVSHHPIFRLVKEVIAFTVICETCGFMALYFFFLFEGVENTFWSALFHSVSAFCTAGFSLFSTNFEGYKHHFGINAILSLLSLLGAFGFFLWIDFFNRITEQKALLGLVTRVLKPFAAAAIPIAAFFYFLMAAFPMDSPGLVKLIISFFQITSVITTTGFNTVDIGTLPLFIHLLLIFLMLLGVTLTGNGIHMRGTSFTVLLKLMANVIKNRKTNSFRNQKTFLKRTQIAFSSFASYLLVFLVSVLLLYLVETKPLLPLFFETASALCTVGLSTGITADLSSLGKILIVLFMLVGRIGILIMGFAFSVGPLIEEKEKRQELVF